MPGRESVYLGLSERLGIGSGAQHRERVVPAEVTPIGAKLSRLQTDDRDLASCATQHPLLHHHSLPVGRSPQLGARA